LNANFITYPTAISAKLFALAALKSKEKGILPPEALDNEIRNYILKKLNKVKNITIKKDFPK